MQEATPSRTALRVAMRRAAHQIYDEQPLVFPDPLALQLLPPDARAELERTPAAARKPHSAAMRAFMVSRARFAEDVLAEGVRKHGIKQALVLGAGLDTFAYRHQYPDLHVFEVDHPATQQWKRELLQTAAIPVPDSVSFVAVDFERQSLREELLHAGFDLTAPTATAWLGVVPYLTPQAFAATTRLLGSFVTGSSVVFDYAIPRETLPPVEQLMLDSLAARVARAGEPFQLFFSPQSLAEELSRCGLNVVEDLDPQAIKTRYLTGRSDGLTLYGRAAHLCHARVQEAPARQ